MSGTYARNIWPIMRPSKFAGVTRAQLLICLNTFENELTRLKWGSRRDQDVRRLRQQVLDEIQERDRLLVDKWDRNETYAKIDRC